MTPLDVETPLVEQEAGDLDLELGGGHRHRLVARQVGVPDAGQHVGDWIGQHCGLPARLRHARNLAVVCHLTEADTAESELAVNGSRPAAAVAAGVGARLEFCRKRLSNAL